MGEMDGRWGVNEKGRGLYTPARVDEIYGEASDREILRVIFLIKSLAFGERRIRNVLCIEFLEQLVTISIHSDDRPELHKGYRSSDRAIGMIGARGSFDSRGSIDLPPIDLDLQLNAEDNEPHVFEVTFARARKRFQSTRSRSRRRNLAERGDIWGEGIGSEIHGCREPQILIMNSLRSLQD